MSLYVLVHGMGGGAWYWRRVEEELRARGHEVFVPTLTGLGDRAHLLTKDTDLETHITDVASLLDFEDLHDVTLVGHSYGGMVVTGVADRERGRIGTLVYLDAFLPEDGQSVMDLQPPDRIDYYRTMAAEKGDGWRIPHPPATFWKLTDDADIARFDRHAVDHPLASLEQPLELSNPPMDNRAYIWASGFTPSPFKKFAAAVREDAAWTYHEIDAGHMMMISHPEATADVLLSCAQNS